MTLLIYNATVLNPADDGGVEVQPRTSLVIEQGKIVGVLRGDTGSNLLEAGAFDHVVDGENHLLVPGLVNTHHHLYQSLTRCLPAVQNVRLFDWLTTLYPHWRSLDYAALKLAAKVSLAELLLHGGTTTSDHHYMLPPGSDARLEAVLDAAEEMGVRIHLCRGSMTLGESSGGLPPDDCVEADADVLADYDRVLSRFHDPAPHAMRRIDLAPCSPFNVTRELMRDTRALARERGVLLHTHLAETLEEDEYCLQRYGVRPLRYLADMDWLGPDVYLAHCVRLNDDDVTTLSLTATAVAHCPTSNMRLSSGIAPLEKLLAAGVRVGVGVDGSSSNDGGDVLGEARQALLAARTAAALKRKTAADGADTPLFSAEQALRLATVGGASVLQRPELGRIEVGAAADLALFRTDDIALAGAAAQDPVAALMFCAAPRADHVFVAGRQVVCEGRLTVCDERRLAADFNRLVAQRFR